MRRTATRALVAILSAVVALTLGLSLASAGTDEPATRGNARVRPVIFVHGFFGSGAQFETQALRFTSNGYPAGAVAMHEYDSLFGVEDAGAVFARLDQRVNDLLRAFRVDQVDLLGHSLGTSLMQQYLASDPARAAKVAHYVNLDGSPAAAPPGGVPTLAIWGSGSAARKVGGAANIYFTNQAHVQVVSSVETFEEIYTFFTGREPGTTNVVANTRDPIKLSGRAVNFPQNTGVVDATLQVFEVNGATGARVSASPEATFALPADGSWGPFNARAGRNYEFAIVRPGARTHHLYFEPFVRSDSWIRLLSSPPTGGIGDLIEKSERHAALTITRNKEWWGDQGTEGDTLEINGVSILNAANSPTSKRAIGVFAFDVGSDGVTNVTAPISGISGLPFLTGVDIFVPAETPATGTISIVSRPRGGVGRSEVVNVPNWASSTDAISVQFNDYLAP